MTSQSQKELVDGLYKHRAEVSQLRNSLNELDREKESWFKKKDELSGKIKENIQKIKENKIKRDSLTKDVREFKLKRDNINREIFQKSNEFDKSRRERSELAI